MSFPVASGQLQTGSGPTEWTQLASSANADRQRDEKPLLLDIQDAQGVGIGADGPQQATIWSDGYGTASGMSWRSGRQMRRAWHRNAACQEEEGRESEPSPGG